MDVKKEK